MWLELPPVSRNGVLRRWESANAGNPHDDGKEVSWIGCSRNGEDAIIVHEDETIRAWAMDPRGIAVHPLTLSADEKYRLALSPDWRRIAMTVPTCGDQELALEWGRAKG